MTATTTGQLSCMVCEFDLTGLGAEQSCPGCGLHVRRSIAARDAERILDLDEVVSLIPAMQDIFGCLESRATALQSARAAEESVAQAVITAAIQAGERPNIRASVIRALYWSNDEIKVKWIQEAFGINAHQVRTIAGSVDSSSRCQCCGEPLLLRSRSSGVGRLCSKCTKAENQARSTEWEAVEIAHRIRLHKLQTMPYSEYLRTDEWQERRKNHLRSAGCKCQLCNAGGLRLDVHHRTYERRGCEHFKDLIVLCEVCHDIFHREGKLSR